MKKRREKGGKGGMGAGNTNSREPFAIGVPDTT